MTILVGVDLFFDSKEGLKLGHVLLEGSIGSLALFSLFFILKNTFVLKKKLEKEIYEFHEFKKESEAWRTESRKYVEGLSKAIDQQLTKWQLSTAEKEVAFLLLKGLSLKEVAQVRSTSEKTARAQSMAIYAKSGLSGRSELSAFFLEELLLPSIADSSNN